MDITALRYFIVVAQTEHMNRAAAQLHITQPSLSTSIRRLEADIGFKLFDRNGRNIQLNEYGKVFLDACLRIEDTLTAALSDMDRIRTSAVSYLRLCCSNSSTNAYIIDQMLSKGMHLQVSEIAENWEQLLLNSKTDLVITMGHSETEGISHTILHFRQLAAVVHRTHPLASAGKITLAELQKHAFCSTASSHSMINVIRAQCPELSFRPRIAFLGRNSADMLKAIQSGVYVGIMVKRNLPESDDLVVLDVEDFRIFLPIYLYWRSTDTAIPEQAAARDEIQEFYQSLDKELP
ncbi:MAG: LysR family transcriptional regulator [Stomatobaculum sp.]|nr:LysR family transcriptional regulator [Stomatobaculum sp.]